MGPGRIVQGPDGPMIQPTVTYQNRPAEMDMDILIDAVPDTANIQQEQFAELVKLAGIYGPAEVPFEDLLEASNLPKKRQLIEKRQTRAQEAQQGQQPQQAMQQAAFDAELAGKQAKAALDAKKAEGQEIDNQAAAFQLGMASTGMTANG